MIEITAPPIPGLFMGTGVSSDVIASVNRSIGASDYFGSALDPYRDSYNAYVSRYVRPVIEAQQEIKREHGKAFKMDAIYALTSREDLMHTPPSMELPILMHPEVRWLLEKGRIEGYGYTPDDLPEEDCYGRLINNGRRTTWAGGDAYEDVFRVTRCSTDPQLTAQELDDIERTRNFIDDFLYSTMFDPTSPEDVRG